MSPAFSRTPVAALLRSAVCLLLLLSSASAQDLPPEPRPIAYWPLTNDTLNIISDEHHGQLLGEATFRDNALSLNGTNACVSFGETLPPPDSFSVCLWVYPALGGIKPDRDDRLMRLMGKFQVADDQREWCVFLSDSNRVWAFVSDDGTADPGHTVLKATRENALSPGEWHHLAVTWQAGGETAIYVDGKREPAVDGGAESLPARLGGTAALTLGAYDMPALSRVEGRAAAKSAAADEDGPAPSDEPLTLTNAFQGAACQLLLFSSALSQEAIRQVAEWAFPEGQSPSRPLSPGDGARPVHPSVEPDRAVRERTIDGDGEEPHGNRGRIVYVDAKRGDDRFSGLAPAASESHGPKRTVHAGLGAVEPGGTVIVAEGVYRERVVLDGVRMVTAGRAVIAE